MGTFLSNSANRIGSSVNNVLGNTINDILGSDNFPAEDIPLYEKFFYNILADADNAITEKSHWVVFFSMKNGGRGNGRASLASLSSAKQLLSKTFSITNIKNSISNQLGLKIGGQEKASFDLDIDPWRVGTKTARAKKNFYNIEDAIMLVQGIEIPGEGFEVNRQGDVGGGFLRPPLTGSRNNISNVKITFLENNSSVVDLVLRPWVIESSYASLKFANKAEITCYNLTRSPTGFRVRKKFTFHNAVPVSIDSEQYTYTAASDYGIRQTEFVITGYTLDEGNEMKDDLFKSVANFVLQKTRRLVVGAIETGVDVVAGGADRVLTNLSGHFQGAVDDHLQNVQSKIREYGKNAEDSIIEKGQRLIDKAIGFDKKKDNIMRGGTELSTIGVDSNPSPRVAVTIQDSDSLTSPPIPPKSQGVSGNIEYKIIKIPQNSVPDTKALNIKPVTINNNAITVQTNSIKIEKNDNIKRS